MGNRLTDIESPQGFASESSGASVISLLLLRYPLSTTHRRLGRRIGSGLGKRLASVPLGKAGQMASGWCPDDPRPALIGAGAWKART